MTENIAKDSENLSFSKRKITIADLYPNLTPAEQSAAEQRFEQYLNLVRRIYERLKRENPQLLTQILKEARLKKPATSLRQTKFGNPQL